MYPLLQHTTIIYHLVRRINYLCMGVGGLYPYIPCITDIIQQENGGKSCVSYIAAFFERKYTLEMEKTAHSQSNGVSFAVTIFLSGQTGRELCLFKNLK